MARRRSRPGSRAPDAIEDGVTGVLADSDEDFEGALKRLLGDPLLRRRLGRAACERALSLTWENTARGTLAVLAAEARRRAGSGPC